MKNSADLGGCYPPRPSASVDNTLLDLQNSSYPTQPYSIIANYGCINWSFPKRSSHQVFQFLIVIGPRYQMSKVVCMASCWDCQDFYQLEKQNEDCMTEKLNILKRLRVTVMRLLSRTTSRQLVTT